jgi:CHAT domain-containing protein/tetratricopeptide (TPR) repeat protein
MAAALPIVATAFGAAALVAVASVAGPDAAVPSPTRLTVGEVVEHEMAPGDTHRYEIELRAGEYLQVQVEQRGVDVMQTLIAPDGETVLRTDTPCGDSGPEPLAVVAAVAGAYQLNVDVVEGARQRPASYELRVEAVREPGPLDLLRVKTVKANADAVVRFAREPGAALPRFLDAVAGWDALGERRLRMCTESVIGAVYWTDFDQFQEAHEWFRRFLASAVELKDEPAEASARTNLAQMLRRLGHPGEAKTELERALVLHRAAGRKDETTRALKVLGDLLSHAGETQAAFDHLHEALQISRAEGDAWGESQTRLMMGSAYLAVGDPELALEHLQLALPLIDDELARATCIRETGVAHFQRGDLAQAREAYARALDIFKPLGNRVFEATTYLRLGELHLAEGDPRKAREVLTPALAVYQARGHAFGEGLAQCRLGETHRRLGDLASSRAAFQAALNVAPRAGAAVTACAEEGLARTARDAGDLDAARAHAESALALAESRRADVASDRVRATSLAASQPVYELLIEIHMRRHEVEPDGGHDVAALDVAERARARSLLELLGEGTVDVRHGATSELLAEERSLRRRFNTAAAAQAATRAAGRTERVDTVDRDLDRLSVELAEVEGRIRRASPRYAALTQAQPVTLAGIRGSVLDADTQLLQYALGTERSFLWVVSSRRLESFRLAPRAEIESAARRVHELMSAATTSAGAARAVELQAARGELSRLILAPATGALTARRLLVVAPGALQYVPLGSLTLADGTLVLARFELISAPSASVIATLRNEKRRAASPRKAVAVFADPVFDASDPRLASAPGNAGTAPLQLALRGSTGPVEPMEHALRGVRGTGAGGGLGRLPFSRQEADAIITLVPAKDALKATGFDATRDAATDPRLAGYRIVHFATHGVLNARRPELSGVVLSLFDAGGRRQDGFLRLHDVYNLQLDADLVVLSGCQTALGKDLRGEGLMGLTRGFMYAGARSVVASLWQVDDESTAELMKRFYRAMLKDGRRPADALRTAQLEMSGSRRWSAPFYWAGFVLQGEWR